MLCHLAASVPFGDKLGCGRYRVKARLGTICHRRFGAESLCPAQGVMQPHEQIELFFCACKALRGTFVLPRKHHKYYRRRPQPSVSLSQHEREHCRSGARVRSLARDAGGHSQRGHAPGDAVGSARGANRSEEHTSELQSLAYLVCRLLLEKK